MTASSPVVRAVFPDPPQAEQAIEALEQAGFPAQAVHLSPATPGQYSTGRDPGERNMRRAPALALAGAAVGAVLGALAFAWAFPGGGGFGGATTIGGAILGGGMGALLGLYAGAGARTMARRTYGAWLDVPVGSSNVLLEVDAGPRAKDAHDVLASRGALMFLDETHRDWS